jgi:para-nitrobenzyl esterase
MLDYWSRFIADGAPDATGQPEWPALGTDVDAPSWMSLQSDSSRVVTDFGDSHQCAFWANLPR